MDEDLTIINSNTRKEKIKNFFITNKKIISYFLTFILILIFIFFGYQSYNKSKIKNISDEYNSAIIKYSQNNKDKTKNILVNIVNKKNPTYSPLSLYFIIDNELIENKKDINDLFDILIDKTSLDDEIRYLIIYKKSLFNADSSSENELLKMLDPIIKSNSIWKSHALYLMAEFFYNKKQNQKAREFFEKIIVLENSNVSEGPKQWQEIKTEKSSIYSWDEGSTYVKKPPFFDNLPDKPEGFKSIKDARPLLILGDMVTTDHISPAGNIQKNSPTGDYFMKNQIQQKDFNSYGSRRGNHEVMMRGTFANIRIRNEMAPGTEGGYTKLYPEGKVMTVYDAVVEYKKRGTDLIVVGGKEYGTGSSRDWAAKGTKLLGIKVVLAESFERIHRSNLIGMGILPLQQNRLV